MRDIRQAGDRTTDQRGALGDLHHIRERIAQALTLADACDEHFLGARLDECLGCIDRRLEEIDAAIA